jgi:hypothetical protein
VDIGFDEDMHQDTLPAALSLVDATGKKVDGTVTVGAWTIHFTPVTPWVNGNFSAPLAATATDLVGNPASAVSWEFTIDAIAPAIVATQPLQGAVDVPLASGITLQFSEPVLPSSVSAAKIAVLYDGAILTQVSYQTSGTQVTLTPLTTLTRGKAYSINITGVTDLAGNALMPTQLQFTTDPGRFGAPRQLPAPPLGTTVGTAVAIGDVNGDGRPDVVLAAQLSENNAMQAHLAVVAQRADGSLGDAQRVPLQSSGQGIGITIADINGDGLNDVLITEGDVGVEIVLQTSDGRLVSDRMLNTGTASRLRVVAMNGDGRPVIVSFGSNVISVWLNLPGGWVAGDSVTVTSYPVAWDLAVGDVNGDGRLDVIAAGNLFIQRSVSMTSESIRPGGPKSPSNSLTRRLRSVLWGSIAR